MRRLFVVAVVVAAFAGSAIAEERTAVTKQQLQAIKEAAPVMPVVASALFTIASETTLADGVWIPAQLPNIVVARKNADGTISTTCVTSETAARTILRQPLQRHEATKPVEK